MKPAWFWMKKITINEIAEKAGVSKTTVSFYLNGKTNKMSEDTKQRLKDIIEETGYEPSAAARAMKSKGSGLLGVIMGDISEAFAAQALKGMEDAASAMGYQVMVGNSGLNFNSEKDYIDRMLKLGAEGFLIQSTYRFGMLAASLEKKNKKVVYVGAKPYDSRGKCVKSNNYECVYQMIMDCVSRGYEDFIMFSDDATLVSTGFENTQGYKDALQDCHRKGISHYVTESVKSQEIYDLLVSSIHLEQKTLIYAANDWIYPIVYQAIRKYPDYQSLIPEQIGLIGFDLNGWTHLTTPVLSAILVPAYQEGQKAAEELMEMLEGKSDKNEIIFKNAIKWRESTL